MLCEVVPRVHDVVRRVLEGCFMEIQRLDVYQDKSVYLIFS